MIRSAVIVEGYGLDLVQDVATDFTYSIQDIREPDKRRTDFSKTINIPGTPKNNALFAHIFDINVENDYDPAQPNIGYNYNPNKAAKAIVLVDGIQVFRGVIRVLKITKDKGVINYETNVLGRLADILFAFRDSTLADIDFTDLDHTLTVAHLDNVWNDPGSFPYTYPLIDYGLTTDGVNYPIGGFAPAIYVKEYVDRMFAAAGFTYRCDFFGMPYFESLIIPNTEKNEFTQDANSARFLECYSTFRQDTNKRTGQWREIYNVWGPSKPKDKYGFIQTSGGEGAQNHITFTRDIETSVQFIFVYLASGDGYINVRLNGEVIYSIRSGTYAVFPHHEIIEIPKRWFRSGDVLVLSMDIPPKGKTTFVGDTSVIMPSPNDTDTYPIDNGGHG
jgi:hypothetical protein